jgi:hypothetical protein
MRFNTHAVFDGPQTLGMRIQFMQKRVVTTTLSSELAKTTG